MIGAHAAFGTLLCLLCLRSRERQLVRLSRVPCAYVHLVWVRLELPGLFTPSLKGFNIDVAKSHGAS